MNELVVARDAPGARIADDAGTADSVAGSSAAAGWHMRSARIWESACTHLSGWIGSSLGRRFVTMSLGLLLVIQLTSFIAIDASMHRHAFSALPEQLNMGTRTLRSVIDWRSEKYIEGAKLLAADYGFRAAVLSNDRETISSVLSNHGARIGASEVALLGTNLATIALADGNAPDAAATAASVRRLTPLAVSKGAASEIAVFGGVPRQVVLVPVKAPALMGWVLVSFSLPESLSDSVHQLSGTDLTLLSRESAREPWKIALTRLHDVHAAGLAKRVWDSEHNVIGDPGMLELVVDGHDLGVRALWLTAETARTGVSNPATSDIANASHGSQRSGDRAEVLALLTVSVDEALRPPRDLQITLIVTTLLAFLAFGVVSAYAARRITTPLQSLAAAAERLGSGDYSTAIRPVGSLDEVGDLAIAFEHMRVSVATKQEQILQSEKLASIGQLAAGVAHEINNPIGFVFSNFGSLETYLAKLFRMLDAYREEERGLSGTPAAVRLKRLREEIELEYLQEDIPALMSESKDGIKRVRKIVQDLKDFSHVDTRQEWERADLHAGLDSTLNIVGNEVKYKAEVVKEYGALPEVECLPNELNQVFMNLLVNAAHAIGDKPGDRKGSITLRSGTSGTDVWVEVVDNGGGIAPQDIKRIFDPFFTTKPVGKGTGLGLSLSYGIVKKHGGRIDVSSEVGRGTTFRVTIPAKRVVVV